MTSSQSAAGENLTNPPGDYASDPCCQEVLEFLKRHPRTRFSRRAIVHALNSHRLATERALSQLTASGVIRQCSRNNILLYSLSAE